jgi:hypothetical protein
MNRSHSEYRSYLFTIRIWAEYLGDDQIEWRGRVQHIASGEIRYFRDWPTLIQLLLAWLPALEPRSDPE